MDREGGEGFGGGVLLVVADSGVEVLLELGLVGVFGQVDVLETGEPVGGVPG